MSENLKIVSSIAYSNNKIFFQDNQGTLHCLSAANGMLIWNIQSSNGKWKGSVNYSGSGQNNIIVRDNDLYFIDSSGNLFCVDALLGKPKWNINNILATGNLAVNDQNEFILPTSKNKIAFISTKLEKVTSEFELPNNKSNEYITDLVVLGDKIIVGYSDGWVYKINVNRKVEKFFRDGYAPIVSLEEVQGNCLVTDYDGQFTLLNIASGKK